MEHLGDAGQVEACFGPFEDSVNLSKRLVQGLHHSTICSKIILGTPDGTPR